LLEKARGVRIFFLDVDGVMTDGGLYFTSEGEAVKKFNSLDGHGLKLLMLSGIVPVVITGRDSQALRRRISELSIQHAHYGVDNKLLMAENCLQSFAMNWSHVAAMGDDWPDLPVLFRSAIAFAPAQAHTELLSRVDHVCLAAAGGGAVREACDLLLMANGYYTAALDDVLS
jgi:3-deoxy-D-manno-octulosonate 8-phosphate phosphatase (KDO 8-P phosphatase)